MKWRYNEMSRRKVYNKDKKDFKSNSRTADKEKKDTNKDSKLRGGNHHIIVQGSDNDPSWYNNIVPAVTDYANIPFNIPTGTTFSLGKGDDATVGQSSTIRVVPGIMTFDVMPTIGSAKAPTDGINLGATQLYAMIRKANSGAKNYDPSDVMLTILAMDSAYMLYEYLLRAYRSIGVYNTMNRYEPNSLLYAQGFGTEISTQIADFRGLLDLFAYQLGSINIPDVFSFVRRHSWLFSHVYCDSDSPKAQLYMYMPAGFYKYSEGQADEPTSLKYLSWSALFGSNVITDLSQVRNAIDTIMQPILGSQDIGIISGDIAKAFGDSNFIKIQPVADHEALVPEFNLEVIEQMTNCDILDYDSQFSKNAEIVVDNSNTLSGPFITQTIHLNVDANPISANSGVAYRKRLVTTHNQNVTPDDVMVMTRMMANVDRTAKTLAACGSDIVVGCKVWEMTHVGTVLRPLPTHETIHQDYIIDTTSGGSGYPVLVMQNVSAMECFDYHPTLYFWTKESKLYLQSYFQSVDNYTTLDDEQLRNIHHVAILSMFTCDGFSIAVAK